ncbi:MAG TPA: GNAT family N-acetyltransferase [Solirubrobacteraceae bacterium]
MPDTRDSLDGEIDVALRDGSAVHLRRVGVDADADAIRAFFEALSVESLGLRFFGMPSLDWVTRWAVDLDYVDRYAVVATTGQERTIVAHGAYIRTRGDCAEVAFVVADAWQGHGIATIMLGRLAAVAQQHGIAVFTADVLPHNHRMIDVFRDSGFPVELHRGEGVIEVRFPTSLSAEGRLAFERREQTASVAAVRAFLRPASVAVIGASRRRGTIAAQVLERLLTGGYAGPAYPINCSVATTAGCPAYASVGDVADRVELAVLAVPAADVAAAARECGAAGVSALVVIAPSAGETDPAGTRRQHELLGICREAGMRLVGPNSLGVLNTAPDVRLDASLARTMPPHGHVGLLSQSTTRGAATVTAARSRGLRLSSFVSVGGKADVSGNDLLEYWEQDPDTDVILLQLESFGNPRRFARIARRVGRSKPIVAVKPGLASATALVSAARDGQLRLSPQAAIDGLFEQAGVIRTETIHELVEVGLLLSAQPVPAGRRVVIVSNAGDPGNRCAEACRDSGLDVVDLPVSVRQRLSSVLPLAPPLVNPIDLTDAAAAHDYRRTIEVLVHARACDAILTNFVSVSPRDASEAAREIHAAGQSSRDVTLAAVFMTSERVPPESAVGGICVPRFESPEHAARGLGCAARYAGWRARPPGNLREPPDCRPDEAAAIVARSLGAGAGWLGHTDVAALLACYGLAPRATCGAASGRCAQGLVAAPIGGQGVELSVAVVHDASFGPVIVCGAVGASLGLAGATTVRVTPLTDLDARDVVSSLTTGPLLDGGLRGSVGLVEDLLLRVSALVEAVPEIAELHLNLVVASTSGVAVVDARARLEISSPRSPLSSLRT